MRRVAPHQSESTRIPPAFEKRRKPPASLFGSLGISTADYANQVPHRFVRRSNRLLTVCPRSNRLTNDLRCRQSPATSQPRDALARLFVNPESERGGHEGV